MKIKKLIEILLENPKVTDINYDGDGWNDSEKLDEYHLTINEKNKKEILISVPYRYPSDF